MNEKTRKWLPIKEMLFTYLAISKMMYWLNIVTEASGFDGVLHAVLERLINRDIVLILVIVFLYVLEHKFIMNQKWNNFLAQVILIIVGYVLFSVILITYVWVLHLIFTTNFSIRVFMGSYLAGWTITYFVIAIAAAVQEHFKKKAASEYAIDIKSMNIKLEMLQALLNDGVLSQEEFDMQKVRLLEK